MMKIDIDRHPCFNKDARHTHARVHLPVAPRCNVQCRFCDRRYDCVNESRPGVTSTVLTPEQALLYIDDFQKKRDISVVGIAGPGDPFANPEETIETLTLVREKYPHMILCVSTNGLNVLPYVETLAALDVTHVTITVCAVTPEIASEVYAWVRPHKKPYRGVEAGKTMIESQLRAIRELKRHDIIVKINTILVPGINIDHVEKVAETCAGLGVDIINPIPMVPHEGCEFGMLEDVEKDTVDTIKRNLSLHLPVMTHCQRCRADAAGFLGENNIEETSTAIKKFSTLQLQPTPARPCVAVATMEGLLVNCHLGEAPFLEIFRKKGDSIEHVESRKMPEKGSGDVRWMELSLLLSDCSCLLCSGAGEKPISILKGEGITVKEIDGMIEDALVDIYSGRDVEHRKVKPALSCSGCGGSGTGCG